MEVKEYGARSFDVEMLAEELKAFSEWWRTNQERILGQSLEDALNEIKDDEQIQNERNIEMNENRELLLECFLRCGGNTEMAAKAYNFILDIERNSTFSTTGSDMVWSPDAFHTETTPLSGDGPSAATCECGYAGPASNFEARRQVERKLSGASDMSKSGSRKWERDR